jgi:WD40 repeat protein
VFAVVFNKQGTELFTGSRDQTIRIWNVADGTQLDTLAGHGQFVTCLALNPDGTRLAAGSWFGEIVLFDVASRDQIASFRAHDAAIRGIDFSPDGRWLASASYDSTVRLLDSASRAEADAARTQAQAALSDATERVWAVLGHDAANHERVQHRLAADRILVDADPWTLKAALRAAFPPSQSAAPEPADPDQ